MIWMLGLKINLALYNLYIRRIDMQNCYVPCIFNTIWWIISFLRPICFTDWAILRHICVQKQKWLIVILIGNRYKWKITLWFTRSFAASCSMQPFPVGTLGAGSSTGFITECCLLALLIVLHRQKSGEVLCIFTACTILLCSQWKQQERPICIMNIFVAALRLAIVANQQVPATSWSCLPFINVIFTIVEKTSNALQPDVEPSSLVCNPAINSNSVTGSSTD